MTDHQQAAIEAGADALWSGFSRTYGMGTTTSEDYEREAEITIAAAEPHLRKKWAGEARKLLNMRADFQGPHATARNRGIHDVISLLEGAGE